MNKKLLLILSILMSLSLFTMSCAKSVAAPDNPVTGIVPGQEFTQYDLEQKLKTLTPISYNGEITFDFSKGTVSYYTDINGIGYYRFSVTGESTSVSSVAVPQDVILTQLRTRLLNYNYNNNDNTISFTPSGNWEDTTTTTYRDLVVTVDSKYYTIPQELKTVKIRLYLINGYWQ
ncbi:hypothetical protein R4K92_11075 [Brachyspira intermedia]|uniref:hypothetical protein n=1 Tax=Brachyspira intermedia TaxID=84377 RepID=UPI00300446ED